MRAGPVKWQTDDPGEGFPGSVRVGLSGSGSRRAGAWGGCSWRAGSRGGIEGARRTEVDADERRTDDGGWGRSERVFDESSRVGDWRGGVMLRSQSPPLQTVHA